MTTENFVNKLMESFLGNIVIFGFNLLFPYEATQLYGASILGKYTYGYSIVMMTIFIATLGLSTGLL